jgi:toxin ParE1/3/4
MRFIHRSPEAVVDLWEIAEYIARDKPTAAARFLEQMEQTIQAISQFPGMGASRDELLVGMRSLPIGNYIVFYRHSAEQLFILRVIHGARDLREEFGT